MGGTLLIVAAWALVRLLLLPIIDPLLMQGDDVYYVTAARNLITTGGFGLSQRPPGYPLFLAATLWMGTTGVFAVQSLLVLATAIFTRYRLSFWAGLTIAACPFFPFFEWSLLSEILALVLLWCGWLLAFYPIRRFDPFVGAAFVGLALLTRDTLLLLPLTAILCLSWKRALVFVAITYLPIALWMAYAPSTQGRFGFNLWIGTWEHNADWKLASTKQWPDYAFTSPAERPILEKAFRNGDDKPFIQAAVARYRTDPAFALKAWARRYRYLWIGTRTELTRLTLQRGSTAWVALKAFMFLLNAIALGLGLVGAFIAVGRRDPKLVLPIAYTALIYVPLHNTEMRYSLIAIPFLLTLGVMVLSDHRNLGVQKN